MTCKEICVAWIRRCHPDLTDQVEIERLALAFWEASPSGELSHVFDAADILEREHAQRLLEAAAATGKPPT